MQRPKIWNIEKKKVGDRMAKLNEKKSDSKLERKLRSYLLEEHENFLPAVSKQKILAPTKVKMSE